MASQKLNSEQYKMAKFGQYLFIGDVDLDGTRKLHDLVKKYKNCFFTNHDVQDVLLNDGYDPEPGKERPGSFYDLYDTVFLRTKTSIHLGCLEKMIELATVPKLMIIKRTEEGIVSPQGQGVVYPNKITTDLNIETPEGYDLERVEEIRRKWFEELTVVEDIRSFQETLKKAFEEFNLKFTLFKMDRAMLLFIPKEFGEVYKIQEKIVEAFGEKFGKAHGKRLTALDDAYYNKGKRFLQQVGQHYKKLNQSDFGRMFVLSPDEDEEAMRTIMSRM